MPSKKRWAINYASTFGLLVTQAGVGLFLAPYLINHLSISVFGVVQFSQNFIAYLTIVSLVIQTAMGRHLSIAIGKNQHDRANEVFNIGFWAILSFCIILVPTGLILSQYLPIYLGVSVDEYNAVSIFFGWVFVSVATLTLSAFFLVVTYSLNRIEIKSLVEIFSRISKIVFVVILFMLLSPAIENVGIAFWVSSVLTLFLAYFSFKSLAPYLRISHPKNLVRSDWKPVLTSSGWVFITQLSGLLFIQTELIVIGGVYGTESLGQYAALIIWVILFRSFASAVSGVLNPVFFKQASVDDPDSMLSLALFSMKVIGGCIAIPLGFVLVFSESILSIWISPEFGSLAPILCVLLIHLIVNLTILPLMGVQVALDKVKTPAIVSLFLGVLNVILMVCVSIYTNFGIIFIAIVGALVLTLKNGIFTVFYNSKILNANPWRIYRAILSSIGILTVSLGIYYLISKYYEVSSVNDLAGVLLLGLIPALLVSWSLFVNMSDKAKVIAIFTNK